MPKEVNAAVVTEVKDVLGGFDPANTTKKGIREVRKVLQKLSQAMYPKKAKAAKKGKSKK